MPRRVPFLPLLETTDGPAACVAMALARFGHWEDISRLRGDAGKGQPEEMRRAMERRGLHVDPIALNEAALPALAKRLDGSWIVLERRSRRGVWIVDPALGHAFWDPLTLRRQVSGEVLTFKIGPSFVRQRRVWRGKGRLFSVLRPVLMNLIQVAVLCLLLQFAALAFPLASQLLVDQVLVPKQESWLIGLALGLGMANVAEGLVTYLRGWLLQNIQHWVDLQLQTHFMGHLLSLPMAFFLKRTPGDLVKRAESLALLREALSGRTLAVVLNLWLLLGYLALMLAYNIPLTVATLAQAVVRLLMLGKLRTRNRELAALEQAAAGQASSALVETLTSLETLKASAGQDRVLERYTQRMVQRLNARFERRRIGINTTSWMALFGGVSMALVFYIGGRAVIHEDMTLGALTAFIVLARLFNEPLESLLESYLQLSMVPVLMQRAEDVLEEPREHQGYKKIECLEGHVELEDVYFSYTGEPPWVLNGASLTVRAGEKIALVGRSGQGKSTLARLILGMHQPSRGRIRFDGIPLEELDLVSLRRQVGVVLQDTFLFDDTVRANLSLQHPDASYERVVEAARRADIHHVIQALPNGYSQRLGENARSLSGGERQRLNIARALVGQPRLLLLDEATSALDLETEGRVHAHLAAFGCTRILIAHRLATIKDADRILVLDGGTIVQSGTFDELVTAPGLLQDMIRAMEAARA